MSHTLQNLLTAVRLLKKHGCAGMTELPAFFMYLGNHERFDAARKNFYGHDERSLAIFDWLIQHRSLASFYGASLPFILNNAPFSTEEWLRLRDQANAMTEGFVEGDYLLDRIDTWLLESYSLKGICEVEPGDIVLDCGAFTGNTSLYFSQKTGPEGHVYSFEALMSSFAILSRNMRRIPNVTPVFQAVSDKSGTVRFSMPPSSNTAAASITDNGSEVSCISLDAFAKERNIPKIDFIKMDIEGAEEAALSGAAEIIRTFKPKMALSAYHKPFDVMDLPRQIQAIHPGYVFYLRHFSTDENETVLYCVPQEKLPPTESKNYQDAVLEAGDFSELMGWIGEFGTKLWNLHISLVNRK